MVRSKVDGPSDKDTSYEKKLEGVIMKLKRWIAAAAAAAMVMSVLAGCGNTADSEKTESTATAAGSEAADTAAASEAVNKTGYPLSLIHI